VARTSLLRLTDMRDAITGIEGLIADVGFAVFAENWGMQRAVERGLEIISEASRHVPTDLKELAPEIPWRQIAAIGNLLRHEYQRADIKATWNIVENHLPPLAEAIDRLIVEAERREEQGSHNDR
jgi:uncharacterized protein with HEPN domain